ncbi:MAG: hypothetical protein ACON4T_01150 [Synechococcus sp.]
MSALPQPRMVQAERVSTSGAFELIQGSMSGQKVARQSPLLAGLHRVADGSLCGVVLAVVALAGLTLHWQHRWTVAFRQLEDTRTLSLRLTESTVTLERHFLETANRPGTLVPTKASNLVYLQPPQADATASDVDVLSMIQSWMDRPIQQGY